MRLERLSALGVAIAQIIAALHASAQTTHRLNDAEVELVQIVVSDSMQGRKHMLLDPILCMAARQKAADMGRRNYADHVDPDGIGPNEMVRRLGYVLPDWWSPDLAANYIEDWYGGFGGDFGTPQGAFRWWMNSAPHRQDILAEGDFSKEKTSFGVGYAATPGSKYVNYFIFLSAPANQSTNSQAFLRAPSGATLGELDRFFGARVRVGIPFGLRFNPLWGIQIDGTPGRSYALEYVDNFRLNLSWRSLTNITLPDRPLLLDMPTRQLVPESRFYRAIEFP